MIVFTRRSLLGAYLLASGVLSACGDDGKPKGSECERLSDSLCARTTECAVDAGIAHEESRDAFNARCHTSLSNDLMCSVPSDGSGDFELCNAALQDIPCDVVVTFLNQDQVVAPSSSCGDFFGI